MGKKMIVHFDAVEVGVGDTRCDADAVVVPAAWHLRGAMLEHLVALAASTGLFVITVEAYLGDRSIRRALARFAFVAYAQLCGVPGRCSGFATNAADSDSVRERSVGIS